jgi:hypothetical protein
MMDRTADQFAVTPSGLAADTGYGSVEMLGGWSTMTAPIRTALIRYVPLTAWLQRHISLESCQPRTVKVMRPPKPRRIVIAAYEGVSLLDLAGPLEAFQVAHRVSAGLAIAT